VPCSGAPGATGQGTGRSQRRDSRRRQSPGTFHITGSKKQSEERAALFDVRVHVIVGLVFISTRVFSNDILIKAQL
jgi:hypothetical protein